jgi:hypothetical protein
MAFANLVGTQGVKHFIWLAVGDPLMDTGSLLSQGMKMTDHSWA